MYLSRPTFFITPSLSKLLTIFCRLPFLMAPRSVALLKIPLCRSTKATAKSMAKGLYFLWLIPSCIFSCKIQTSRSKSWNIHGNALYSVGSLGVAPVFRNFFSGPLHLKHFTASFILLMAKTLSDLGLVIALYYICICNPSLAGLSVYISCNKAYCAPLRLQ